jgi:GT2 family glycosyltransferase
MFTLLTRIRSPNRELLRQLIASLEAQTNPDWELILVVDQTSQEDQLLVTQLTFNKIRIRAVLRPADELLAWSCNALLGQLGTWTGLLNQDDFLVPAALETMANAISARPDTRVAYSNECRRNQFSHLSFTTDKGAFDATRLVYQEYLGSLALIQTASLEVLGGFDRLASDVPTHDLYLRVLGSWGPGVFTQVPEILSQSFRSYLEPSGKDPRTAPHMVRYDLYAVRKHLNRIGANAEVHQEHGTIRITYRNSRKPAAECWLIVTDDRLDGLARIDNLAKSHSYPGLKVKVIHSGTDAAVGGIYESVAKTRGWAYERTLSSLPSLLNNALPYFEHDFLAVLDGISLRWGWFEQLIDHIELPGVAAVGGRCIDPRQVVSPGLIGYRYQGWDWNTRGRFNKLQVPHETSALGSGCLLLSTRYARILGGFREDLPTLWAMDYTMRADASGLTLINVPGVVTHVEHVKAIPEAEQDLFEVTWSGWRDRFRLHHDL